MKIVRKSFTGEEKRKERKVETQKSFFFLFWCTFTDKYALVYSI